MNWIQRKLIEVIGGKKALQATRYEIVGGRLVPMADNKRNYINQGYAINDIVYSVVNLILDKIRVAPWNLYKVVDESSLKSRNGILARKDLTPEDYRTVLKLQHKSLEPIDNGTAQVGKLLELLKWANEYETFGEQVANGSGYKLLTGDRYLWGNIIPAGANKGIPNDLWLLPSQEILIQGSADRFPVKEVGYKLICWGLDYAKEEVLHDKYWNPQWGTSAQELYGMSPLKALVKRICKNNAALEAASAKYQNFGMEAIIYVNRDDIPADIAVEQANALKAKLISEYTGPKNAGKIATSGYPVGVANLGLSPVELGILQAEVQDIRMVCNAFGVPSQLMNDPDNKSYNNQKEGEKALTTRSALPLLTSFRDNFNRKLQSDWGFKGKNVYVDFDMTVYTELQETVGETLKWIEPLLKQGWPLNKALEMLNLEELPDAEASEMWIRPDMGVPVSDWRISNVDQALNGNNNTAGNNQDVQGTGV